MTRARCSILEEKLQVSTEKQVGTRDGSQTGHIPTPTHKLPSLLRILQLLVTLGVTVCQTRQCTLPLPSGKRLRAEGSLRILRVTSRADQSVCRLETLYLVSFLLQKPGRPQKEGFLRTKEGGAVTCLEQDPTWSVGFSCFYHDFTDVNFSDKPEFRGLGISSAYFRVDVKISQQIKNNRRSSDHLFQQSLYCLMLAFKRLIL